MRTTAIIKSLLSALTISALPLMAYATDYVTVKHPRQECWTEQVASRSSDYGGAIIGGIAGGILGNQIGGGSGKTIATGVGAATGAVIGDRIASGPSNHATQTVQRCRTVIYKERVPVANRVYYIEHEHHHYYDKHHHHYYKKRHKRHDHDDDDDDD